MNNTQLRKAHKKKLKREKLLKIAIIATLIVCGVILTSYSYKKIFYTRTQAVVIYAEPTVGGLHLTWTGNRPNLASRIELEYVVGGGKIRSEIVVDSVPWIRLGDKVLILYKKSQPKQCFLIEEIQ